MLRHLTILFSMFALLIVVGTKAEAGNKLFGFNGGNAIVQSDYGTPGTWLLRNPDASSYAGVYRKAISHKRLSRVRFSFVSSGDVQGGAPRLSIPVDTDGDPATVEGYAFLDAAGCGASVGHYQVGPGSSDGPVVKVATTEAGCHVNLLGVDYPNWQALVAEHPDWTLAKGASGEPAYSFVIADVPGTYLVSKVNLG
jgi:hypothetical protein